MSAGTTIGFVLIGFVVYVFAKGELASYISLFKKSGASGNVSASSSGETVIQTNNGILSGLNMGGIFGSVGGDSGETNTDFGIGNTGGNSGE